MEQEEIDEMMRLARIAVHLEDFGVGKLEVEQKKAWGDLAAYIMHIAAKRVDVVLKAYDKGII